MTGLITKSLVNLLPASLFLFGVDFGFRALEVSFERLRMLDHGVEGLFQVFNEMVGLLFG